MTRGGDSAAPAVTVLMAVYNGERTLGPALESILGQSCGDFEFLVVEDRSTDGSRELLERYAKQDRRLRILPNPENLGLTRSLQRGLEAARGRCLARLDADDLALPGRLEAQLTLLAARPEVGLVGGGIRVVGTGGKLLREWFPPTEDAALRLELLVKNHAFAHSAVMFRRESALAAGGYDQAFRYAQDYDLWCRLSAQARLASLPELVVERLAGAEAISVLHRQEQLECIRRVSCRELGRKPELAGLDREAYRRVWGAYHGDFAEFRQGDICRLEPLWSYLEHQSERPPETLRSFRELGYRLIGESCRADGRLLLGILEQRLGLGSDRGRKLRSLARSLTPRFLRRP